MYDIDMRSLEIPKGTIAKPMYTMTVPADQIIGNGADMAQALINRDASSIIDFFRMCDFTDVPKALFVDYGIERLRVIHIDIYERTWEEDPNCKYCLDVHCIFPQRDIENREYIISWMMPTMWMEDPDKCIYAGCLVFRYKDEEPKKGFWSRIFGK